jgi:hypothetical protein
MLLTVKSLLATLAALTVAVDAAEDLSTTQATAATLLARQTDVAPIRYTSCEIIPDLAVSQTPIAPCVLSSATTEPSTSSSWTKDLSPIPAKTSTTTSETTSLSVTPSTTLAVAWTSVQTDPKLHDTALTTVFTRMRRIAHADRHELLAKRNPSRAIHNPDLLLSEPVLLEHSGSRKRRVSAAVESSRLSHGLGSHSLQLDLFFMLSGVSDGDLHPELREKLTGILQWL